MSAADITQEIFNAICSFQSKRDSFKRSLYEMKKEVLKNCPKENLEEALNIIEKSEKEVDSIYEKSLMNLKSEMISLGHSFHFDLAMKMREFSKWT